MPPSSIIFIIIDVPDRGSPETMVIKSCDILFYELRLAPGGAGVPHATTRDTPGCGAPDLAATHELERRKRLSDARGRDNAALWISKCPPILIDD
jgi:hypothetical protein